MRPGIALRPDYDAAQLRALAKATIATHLSRLQWYLMRCPL
jgi:hypothetical protein